MDPFGHWGATEGTALCVLGHRPFHLPSLFLYRFLRAAGPGNAQGVENFCSGDILQRLLQEKEGAFGPASGSDLQSTLWDALRWGREENKMWMGGVPGI